MSQVISREVILLMRSVVWGLVMGAVYQGIRVLLTPWFRRHWWSGLEDMIYWTVCGLLLFDRILEANSGIIRWYILAGAAFGAGIFGKGLSPLFCKMFRPVWIRAKQFTHFVENLLKKSGKSDTLKDKVECSANSTKRGKGNGRIRKKEKA